MSFSTIPNRSNLSRIVREWFDNLRDAGAALESVVGAGYIPETSFAVGDNQTAQTITGLIFDKTLVRAARIDMLVCRKSASDGELNEMVTLDAIYSVTAGTWALYELPGSGGDAGVDFLIDDSTGQVKVTSTDMAGLYDTAASKLVFKARTWAR